jgi:membrane protease YdiL (CAAX protease family)
MGAVSSTFRLACAVAIVVAITLPRLAGAQANPYDDLWRRAASPDPAVRLQAVDELATVPHGNATSMLSLILANDIDPAVRSRAAAALGRTGNPAMLPYLERARRADPDPIVRYAAADAARRLRALTRSPNGAAFRSLLCPGCGHYYLDESDTATTYLLGTAGLLIGGFVMLTQSDSVSSSGIASEGDTEFAIGLDMLMAGQNLWFYSIFDAYRDAKVARGEEGGHVRPTRESLADLASAPFRPSVLAKPWIWAGVPLALAAAFGVSYLLAPDEFDPEGPTIFDVEQVHAFGHDFSPAAGFAVGELYYASLFLPVGIGEEALFRGFIQSTLEERMGPWAGWATASAIFGAIHFFNFTQPGANLEDAAIAVPFITLVGSYLGLAYHYTGHRLETSVAAHFWYDFLLGTTSFILDPEHQPFGARITLRL